MDAARSLLLEYTSALSGKAEAHVGMGYRYLHGLGVKASCDRALIHYEYAANEVIRQLSSDRMGSGGLSGNEEHFLDAQMQNNRYNVATAIRGKGMAVHAEFSKLSDTFMTGGSNGRDEGKKNEFDHSVSSICNRTRILMYIYVVIYMCIYM